MDAIFDPPVFRYTVRTPEARHEALKAAAHAAGLEPGQLVQALFDRLDLTAAGAALSRPAWFATDDAKALGRRAAAAGLTLREIRVLRALALAVDGKGTVRPNAFDISASTMIPADDLPRVYERLVGKGFIAIASTSLRGRRSYRIARLPE